ncbi:unnamed protein product [Protopolystoma xenopodis]|uniref:Uncharacterized protein n=1 Tax=Protopolystoma xenopodis TaxID=117903 RepID=A0A448XSZ0_9PLAT|nr:unnamed protein product [Protopolystoma xenopodis]
MEASPHVGSQTKPLAGQTDSRALVETRRIRRDSWCRLVGRSSQRTGLHISDNLVTRSVTVQLLRDLRTVRRGPYAAIRIRFPLIPHHKFLPTNFPFEMESNATHISPHLIYTRAYSTFAAGLHHRPATSRASSLNHTGRMNTGMSSSLVTPRLYFCYLSLSRSLLRIERRIRPTSGNANIARLGRVSRLPDTCPATARGYRRADSLMLIVLGTGLP